MNPADDNQHTSRNVAPAPRGRGGQTSRTNLVALGSAAVLVVYAAGYARTREAAERIAAESERRVPPHVRSTEGVAAPARVPAVQSANAVQADVDITRTPPADTPSSAPPKMERRVTIDSSITPAHVADSASPGVGVPSKSPEPVPTPVDSTPPVNVAASPTTTASPTQPADTATARVMHDGTYSGWGTSRHGDIQATVEIKGGRITDAYISQCLTRYSCSWIAALPPQVVTRQSPEVDYVSGATQSTNAFYYAVVDALHKAK